MDRRRFVGGLAGGLAFPPVMSLRAADRVYRVGFLLGATSQSVASLLGALKEGLREHGYVEGRNLAIVERYGQGKTERLPELAGELARLNVDVIVTGTNLHVAAVRRATSTIPVVMVFTSDPVGAGFIESLAHPGGNITGLTADSSQELWAKYLALLKEVVPSLARVGVLGQVSSQMGFRELEMAAHPMNLSLEVVDMPKPEAFDDVFASMLKKRVDAAVVVVGPLTYQLRQAIADRALQSRLPAICTLGEFAQAGLLMSYGPDLLDLYRRAAVYVDKILRGAKPGDLPAEQPSRYELTINAKTAKAIGVKIPQSLLLRAANVIE